MPLITGTIPAPVPKWAKWLIELAPDAFTLGQQLADYVSSGTQVDQTEWRYLVMRFKRPTPTAAPDDYAQIGLNIVNITGGDIDTSWTTGDYTTCEGFIDEWWNSIKGQIQADHKLYDLRWYRRTFLPEMTIEKRFADSGPPDRVTVKDTAGTSATIPNPAQIAMSVTFKTAVPRHWGRFYLPGLPQSACADGYGRWMTTPRNTVANATAELVDDLQGADFQPFVPVTQVNKQLGGRMLGVTAVQVDDIPDVVRRRRARTALVRTIGAPTA